MKQVFILVVLMFILFGCTNKAFEKAVQEGNEAISIRDYKKSITSFELALKEKKDDETVKTLLDQTQKMLEATKAQSESRLDEATTFYKEVIEKKGGSKILKDQATEGLGQIESIKKYNAQLAQIDEMRKNKKYTEAKSLVNTVLNETSNIEYLSVQHDRAKDLINSIDAEKAKAEARARAYYQIVNNLITEKGICSKQLNPSGDYNGLAYVKTIDFNKNGEDALYMLYVDSKNREYTEEIWVYSDGKEKLIFKENSRIFGGLSSDRSIFLLNNDTNAFLSYESSRGESRGTSFWTIVDGKFLEVASAGYNAPDYPYGGNYKYDITRDGKKKNATESEYKEFLDKYGYNKGEKIIKGDAGSPIFEFDVTKNQKTVLDFMQQLKSTFRSSSLKSNYNDLTINDKKQLLNFLYHFTDIDGFNSNKYTDHQLVSFLVNGLFNQRIGEDELPLNLSKKSVVDDKNGFYYDPYSADKVVELTQKLFGVSIEKKNYSDAQYDIAKYNDGYFYFLSPNKGGGTEAPSIQVDNLYPLNNELFYAEFTIYTADIFQSGDPGTDLNFLRNPIETWNSKEKSTVIRKKSGYAILKNVSGNVNSKDWRLIEYNANGVLTDQEIGTYRKKD